MSSMKALLSGFLLCLSLQSLAQVIHHETTSNTPVTHQNDSTSTDLQQLRLQTFEDNLLGYTFDSDDKPFMDITLSVCYQLEPFDRLMEVFDVEHNLHLSLSFTGRFAQYIGTRTSSPVVGKRFNPQLYLEYTPKQKLKNSTFRLIYGHESNGQAIEDPVTFNDLVQVPNTSVDENIDYISRGWDYWGLGNVTKYRLSEKISLQHEINVRYYLDHGILQTTKEEYRSWEKAWYGQNYTRNEVSGLSGSVTLFLSNYDFNKLKLTVETGVIHPLTARTIRLMAGFKFMHLPLALTYSDGYNGDLAQYGKKNSSFGITLILSSFERPFFQ